MNKSNNSPPNKLGEEGNNNLGLVDASTSVDNRLNNLATFNRSHYESAAELDVSDSFDDQLPPSYEFTLEQTVSPITHSSTRRTFRPPPLNQLTFDDANRILDYAEYAWDNQNWSKAQNHYSTAASIFRIIEDVRNEAFCLQRLGETCRIQHSFAAARAHILQAHILFGQCGEVARQLMCERWLARTASDEGNIEEGIQLLQGALENSRTAGLRESEGWCLLRLGELEGADKSLIQQALDIARDENLALLEARCVSTYSRLQKKREKQPVMSVKTADPPKDINASEPGRDQPHSATREASPSPPTQPSDATPKTTLPTSRIGRWLRGAIP
ncbi:hypothetical protein RhiJN_11616 [Ceratobasidium sp. AG-Ba]|nr:hypothetical protein RhiJN_11616 [Ceratobasidium sp. AG-Ba]